MIVTKIVGTTFGSGQQLLRTKCKEGDSLFLKREGENIHDSNAIAVYTDSGYKLGYVKKEIAAEIAPKIDREGVEYDVFILNITGRDRSELLGCNISLHERGVANAITTN